MSDGSRQVFRAGWGMMDFNGHMANTAYLDMAADTRMMFFRDNGFPMETFMKLGFGPVVRRDEIDYYREILMMEKVDVQLLAAGLSPDGSRMKLRNVFYRKDSEVAAVVTSVGGWLGFKERRLIVPPEKVRDLMASLPKTEDFEELKNIGE